MKAAPYHDRAVFRAAGDDQVIVRTPVDVQHGACVSAHRWVALVYAAGLPGTQRHVIGKEVGRVFRNQIKKDKGG